MPFLELKEGNARIHARAWNTGQRCLAEGSGCHDLGTRLPASSGWGPRMPLATPPRSGRHPQRKNYSAQNVSSAQIEKHPPQLLAFKREKKIEERSIRDRETYQKTNFIK